MVVVLYKVKGERWDRNTTMWYPVVLILETKKGKVVSVKEENHLFG